MKRRTYFHSYEIFLQILYSENVRRPLKENFGMICSGLFQNICLQNPYPNPYLNPKKMSVDPNPNQEKKFSDLQHCVYDL
jgi:hypothetical protein